MNPLFHEVIEKARRARMTETERGEQMISFAYGNVRIEEPSVTRDHVREALERLKWERDA